jgi:hypothetical protein
MIIIVKLITLQKYTLITIKLAIRFLIIITVT